MSGRLVVELTPEEWEAFERSPGPLAFTVDVIELRQGVLVEERPVISMAVLSVLGFSKEQEPPGPGPWLEVWSKQTNQQEEQHGAHRNSGPPEHD